MFQLVHFLESLQHTLQDMGWLGVLAYAGLFVVAQLFMVPVAPMGMAAGLFFGLGRGWLGLMLGCAIGASVNFLISRYFARGFITRKLSGNEKFRLIDSAIAREGWRIVLLMRFVPIPFGLANYCYGISPVPFGPYILATLVAITPPNLLFVWMGSTFQGELSAMLGKGRAHNPVEYVFLALGILAALLALRFAAKIARAAVAKSASEPVNAE